MSIELFFSCVSLICIFGLVSTGKQQQEVTRKLHINYFLYVIIFWGEFAHYITLAVAVLDYLPLCCVCHATVNEK